MSRRSRLVEQVIRVTPRPIGKTDCRGCQVHEQSLLSPLTADEFEKLDRSVHRVEITEGSVLFWEGSNGRYLYMLRSGQVKLSRDSSDGEQRIVRLLAPGDVAGLEATVSGRYDSTATAITPVTACRVTAPELVRLGHTSAGLHRQLLRKWYQALAQANGFIAELGVGNARERIARLALQLVGRSDGARIHLPGREDMGAMIGLAAETASRTTAEFCREGLLHPLDRRGRSYAVDIAGLSSIARRGVS